MKNIQTNKILTLAIALYCCYALFNLFNNADHYFWDFRTYYHSPTVINMGMSPYSTGDLSEFAGREVEYPYTYPPLTAQIFKIFRFGNVQTASLVFLIIKLALLGFLIMIWQKDLRIKYDNLFFLFILLAFNGAVYRDLSAGNVSIIVYFLIWLGIFCFFRGKYLYFCGLILLASLFKLIPIVFLLLLLFSGSKRWYICMIVSLSIFSGYVLINYLMYPMLFGEFTGAALGSVEEKGIVNPSLFWFIRDFFNHLLDSRLGVGGSQSVSMLFYLLSIMTILFVTVKSVLKIYDEAHPLFLYRFEIIVFLFCIVFSFIVPRFKDYDYILLIAPAYYIIIKSLKIKLKYLLLLFFIMSAVHVPLPGIKFLYNLMWDYYPLILAGASWMLYILYINKWSVSDS